MPRSDSEKCPPPSARIPLGSARDSRAGFGDSPKQSLSCVLKARDREVAIASTRVACVPLRYRRVLVLMLVRVLPPVRTDESRSRHLRQHMPLRAIPRQPINRRQRIRRNRRAKPLDHISVIIIMRRLDENQTKTLRGIWGYRWHRNSSSRLSDLRFGTARIIHNLLTLDSKILACPFLVFAYEITIVRLTGHTAFDRSALVALKLWRWKPQTWTQVDVPNFFSVEEESCFSREIPRCPCAGDRGRGEIHKSRQSR
jgi:hypothetical protein